MRTSISQAGSSLPFDDQTKLEIARSLKALSLALLASRPADAFSIGGLQVLRSSPCLEDSGCRRAPSTRANVAVDVAVPTKEVAKLFGRFAEKVLYLDKEVGDCCHSACTDCEWRLPDGGYRFDVMRAGRPKWIPCYFSREHANGVHTPKWAAALFPDGADSTINRADFDDRISELVYFMSMGPVGMIQPADSIPSQEGLDLAWEWLSGGSDTTDGLLAKHMLKRLQDMSASEDREGAIGEGPDSVTWKEFADALGVSHSERC